jgi:hypothetical protein
MSSATDPRRTEAEKIAAEVVRGWTGDVNGTLGAYISKSDEAILAERFADVLLAAEERGAREHWQPIDTANKWAWEEDLSAPPILIARFYNGRMLWMMAATYGVSTYGDIHCASRAGWRGDTMPQMAYGPNKARPVEWIMDSPTHWRPLPPLPIEQGESDG